MSRQRVERARLFDPQGEEVATLTIELPSIADLVDAWSQLQKGGVIDLGHYAVSMEADVVVDEQGRTNLEAALAPRRERHPDERDERRPRPGEGTGDSETEDVLRRVEGILVIECPRFTWTDPRLQVTDRRVALHEVRGELELKRGGTVTLNLEGEQECETRGPFSLVAGLTGISTEPDVLPSTWSATLRAAELSGALADRLANLEGELAALVGETFSVEGTAVGGGRDLEQARFDLRSEAMSLAAVGRVAENRFSLVPESSVIELAPLAAGERIAAWCSRVLPEGTSIEIPAEGLPIEVRELSFSIPLDSEEPLKEADLGLALAFGPFAVRDPFGLGTDEILPLGGLEVSVDLTPGESPRALLKTSFVEQPGSFLSVDARAEPVAVASGEGEGEEEDPWELHVLVEGEGVPIDRLRALANAEDAWEELWGSRLSFGATATVAKGRMAPFRLEARTDTAELLVEGELTEERLRLGEAGLTGALRVPKPVFADMMREDLPEGYVLSSNKAVLPLELRIEELDLDLVALAGAAPLASSSLRGELRVGAIDYTETLLAQRGQQISLEESTVSVGLTKEGELAFSLDATIDAEEGRSLRAQLSTDRAAELGRSELPGDLAFSLRADAVGFPTRVVDLYTEQDGLLVDVLGSRLDASLESDAFTSDGGPLALRASSALGTFHWEGRYREGELISGEEGRMEAAVGLSPLFGERIVGPLVPLLVDLDKPDDAPVLLRGSDLIVPLDGDLKKLEGRLRLELGQITCSLLPGLAAELPGLASKAVQRTLVEPIDLRIEQGVVRYDRLPLKIDGRPVVLAGSYDLSTGGLDLTTNLKIADIGGEVGRALSSVRKALGEDYLVPLRLGGTVKTPKLSLADGFLERALEDVGRKAVENEIQKRLKDLLGGGGE